jgi:hypothetical protein
MGTGRARQGVSREGTVVERGEAFVVDALCLDISAQALAAEETIARATHGVHNSGDACNGARGAGIYVFP